MGWSRSKPESHVSEEYFRLAFEYSLMGQTLVSPQGHFIRVNQKFADMLECATSDLVGKKVVDVLHPDDINLANKLFYTSLVDKVPSYRVTRRYLTKSGQVVWGDVNSVLLRDPSGRPLYYISQVLDITEKLRCEELIRISREQLEKIVEERTKQLQESNAALQSFAYAASHDLREPLIKITAFGQRLEERYSDKLDDKGKQYLGIMQTAASRMLSLIDDILGYSRVGREDSPLENVDLNKILPEVLSDLEMSIEEAKAKIIAGGLPTVRAHPHRMQQVFQNLISNALKFRKPHVEPLIRVTSRESEGVAVITVEDNGIGFDPKQSEKVFEIFTRLHTRFDYPGTGIGLAMCRRILDHYNGKIIARGEPDVGSMFTITIPTVLLANAEVTK